MADGITAEQATELEHMLRERPKDNGTEPVAEPGEIHFRPADELLREAPPKPEWTWEGTLVPGAVTLLAGRAKSGKSTLLYELVKATAEREADFLGRALRGGPVLYASEEALATLAANFPRHHDVHLLHRGAAWPKPAWLSLVAAAAARAREVGAALVVIDTFSFWNGLERDAEQNAGAVQPLLDALAEVANTGAAVLLIHHVRKSGGEDGDAIRGSGAIAAAVDAFCEYERVTDAPATHRQLVVTSRWPAPPVLVVEWREVFGFRVVGQAADREQAAAAGWGERILAALPSEGDGATMDELAELLDADRRKWHGKLAKLVKEERVKRTGRGDRYSPYRHLRAADAAVPSQPSRSEDGGDGSNQLAAVQPSYRDGGGERLPDGGGSAVPDGGTAGCASHREPRAGCRYCQARARQKEAGSR